MKKITYRLILFRIFQSRNCYDVFVLMFKLYINKLDVNSTLFVIEIKENSQSNREEKERDVRFHILLEKGNFY